MIDLKELERMVDEALAKETKESWNKWLDEQENKKLESFLGEGIFATLKGGEFTSTFCVECDNMNYSYNGEEPVSPDDDYKNAA